MRRFPLLVLIVVLIASLSPTVFAQLEEEVQVNVMEIWVKATDRSGNAVRDLQPEDFQVLVDGKNLPFQCFDSTFSDSDDDSVAGDQVVSDEPGRRFIFFFDLLNSMPGEVDYLKARMVEFLRTSFRDNDQAMVFVLLPSVHLGLVQKWTSDRFDLIRVVEKMRGNMTLRASLQNNERLLLDMLFPADTTNDRNPGQDRGVGARPLEGLQQARLLARSLADQDAARSRTTLDSFTTIASYLSGFPGEDRPVLLFISGGFPLYPGKHYFDLVQQAVEKRYVQGPGDLSVIERPITDFQSEVRNTIGRLNRQNVTIYSIDTKGMLTTQRGAERSNGEVMGGLDLLDESRQLQDSLVLVAHETGGTAFINSQDYARGMSDIARDLTDQYWLCVNLPASAKRGRYHSIEVKVNRPGVEVRHRKGYVE